MTVVGGRSVEKSRTELASYGIACREGGRGEGKRKGREGGRYIGKGQRKNEVIGGMEEVEGKERERESINFTLILDI